MKLSILVTITGTILFLIGANAYWEQSQAISEYGCLIGSMPNSPNCDWLITNNIPLIFLTTGLITMISGFYLVDRAYNKGKLKPK